ncbi:MAG TPA: cell envelope biogenesis protein OmpA, partial [Candidatus Caccomonas pullistercoris]|nr:cell envelope biogenesis protein OmpA [Candidatus Caccomonas pullistercoris]
MIKKTMLAALALAASGTAMAQEAQTVQNGDFTETVEYSTD